MNILIWIKNWFLQNQWNAKTGAGYALAVPSVFTLLLDESWGLWALFTITLPAVSYYLITRDHVKAEASKQVKVEAVKK